MVLNVREIEVRNWESVMKFLKGLQVYVVLVKILQRNPKSVIVFFVCVIFICVWYLKFSNMASVYEKKGTGFVTNDKYICVTMYMCVCV